MGTPFSVEDPVIVDDDSVKVDEDSVKVDEDSVIVDEGVDGESASTVLPTAVL